MSALKKFCGFTLIELLVTISIIAVLAMVALVLYQIPLQRARDSKRTGDMQEIQKALEQYYAINRSYPVATVQPTVITNVSALNSYFANQVPPTDPNTSFANYNYYYCASPSKYILCVKLERPTGKANHGGALPSDGCGNPTNSTTPLNYYCLGALSN